MTGKGGVLARLSLRQRLVLGVAAALAASLAIGSWVTALAAARMVRAELSAALETGRRSAAGTLQDLAGAPPRDALSRLVAGFDGSRHVLASLTMPGMAPLQSQPAMPKTVSPGWFTALATPALAPIEMVLPGGVLRLTPVYASEIGERWTEARRLILLLALFSVLAAVFCFAIAAWSLRPLGGLAQAFALVEAGVAVSGVDDGGPPEVARLARAFNHMQDALARAAGENRRLTAQIERLAEEERAELARDLHDDIGPLLFALTAWAAAARMRLAAGDAAGAGESVRAVEAGAASVQSAMRGVLRRLRDGDGSAAGLEEGVAGLAAFWGGITPGVAISYDIAPELADVPEAARVALFRVAQEGVANAMRHARPSALRIGGARSGGEARLWVEDDGAAVVGGGRGGFGLIGLEERLRALGGRLEIRRGAGWRITGIVPAPPR